MRFTSIVACLATVSSAVAQVIAFTSTPEEVKVGETYTFQWSPAAEVKTVSIILRWGDANDLNAGNVLASNLQNTNSYQWSVPSNLFNYDEGEKDTHYAFEIKYTVAGKEESNYSGPIQVEGGKDFTSADKSTSTSTDEDITSTVTETTDMTTTMTTTALDSSVTETEESTTITRATRTRTTTTADDATATNENASETTSDAPSGGSVARSSSLAMVFCILAAVFYLN